MGSMEYFGHYRSSTSAQTGCVKELVTTGHASMDFPVQVMRACELCKHSHNFMFVFGHIASTPKQRATFTAWCNSRGIEQGVQL